MGVFPQKNGLNLVGNIEILQYSGSNPFVWSQSINSRKASFSGIAPVETRQKDPRCEMYPLGGSSIVGIIRKAIISKLNGQTVWHALETKNYHQSKRGKKTYLSWCDIWSDKLWLVFLRLIVVTHVMCTGVRSLQIINKRTIIVHHEIRKIWIKIVLLFLNMWIGYHYTMMCTTQGCNRCCMVWGVCRKMKKVTIMAYHEIAYESKLLCFLEYVDWLPVPEDV